jgi:hypothetical protein
VSELRAAVLSVASVVYFHQDQTYQLASDLHPGDKSVRAEIEKVFNGVFDANRSYRLLYALRNLETHHTMEAVAVDARALQVAPGRVEARFRLRMDRALAVRSGKINKIAKADIDQMRTTPMSSSFSTSFNLPCIERTSASQRCSIPICAKCVRPSWSSTACSRANQEYARWSMTGSRRDTGSDRHGLRGQRRCSSSLHAN